MLIPKRPRWLDCALDAAFTLLWIGILAATMAETIAKALPW
jgi:hypothetical protein